MGFVPNHGDNDDFDGEELEGSALVRDLRKQLKEANKRASETEQRLVDLAKNERQRSLTDALAAKGLNPKIARFFPSDAEPTEEAIGDWLSENADLFGTATNDGNQDHAPDAGSDASTSTTPVTPSVVDAPTEAAYRRMAAAGLAAGAATTSEQDFLTKLAQTKDPEEVTALLRATRA